MRPSRRQGGWKETERGQVGTTFPHTRIFSPHHLIVNQKPVPTVLNPMKKTMKFPTPNIKTVDTPSTQLTFYRGSRMNFEMIIGVVCDRICIFVWSRRMTTIREATLVIF